MGDVECAGGQWWGWWWCCCCWGGGRNVLSPSVKSVTQSQHITVELSAAIKLLEQTLVQWAEEEEEEEEKSRQGGKGKGKGNRRR